LFHTFRVRQGMGQPGGGQVGSAIAGGQSRARAIDLTGQTSIGALGALLSRASLAVLNDSGPAHVAAALRIPSVALFGAADPARWAPIDQTVNRIIYKGVECSPCPHWVCPIDHRCLNWITVEEVRCVSNELLSPGRNATGPNSNKVSTRTSR
ncbi:MAG: glycosyltransferase family 9 protein, partial [Chloroflexi bacterium]|nr:glycosyltransferase family 9 protein [Chloroflexota bacterium]